MTPWPRPWRVEIRETGRCGWLTYHEAGGSISLYWELGGGDTVALIWGEEADHWNVHQAWAAGRRLDILERIAGEVIRQRAPTCRADIQEPQGFIQIRERAE